MPNQENQTQQLHNRVNHAIIKCRGVYSRWAKHLASLNRVEDRAAQIFGQERIRAMAELVLEYDRALETALEETEP